jgi:hypothetical protein
VIVLLDHWSRNDRTMSGTLDAERAAATADWPAALESSAMASLQVVERAPSGDGRVNALVSLLAVVMIGRDVRDDAQGAW